MLRQNATHTLNRRTIFNRVVGYAGTALIVLALIWLVPSVAEGSCCEGLCGNIDCDPAGLVDLGDLTALIDYLFITSAPLCCQQEADMDGNPGIDLGDLTALIDYLFISFAPLRLCDLTGANPSGELVSSGDCKTFFRAPSQIDTPPDMDCIEYQYDENYVLSIKHVNAGFNCCPVILANIYIVEDSITIEEVDSLYMGGCFCLCLFDVEYRITNLAPGRYRIRVTEPYRPESDDPLDFELDLFAPTSGSVCVSRSQYPWGF
jgi:hypothetical protein